ncbi:MAG: metallophosphoesterase [Proteobacteria bacterium]|nr:metallophosphoesterase [Pseudomonadota bacterium]
MSPDLLVISDLHLGEAMELDAPLGRDAVERERALVDFLGYYRDRGRWKLVINGDMVDFLSMTLRPDELGILTGLHPDDHHYGLAQRADSAAIQLEQVLGRHGHFVRALAEFLSAGHQLAIVVGNHDAAFHFPKVREVLVTALHSMLTDGRNLEQLRATISFHDWFLHEDGMAWIEHGHQYDAYCSFEHQLDPLAPGREELDPTVAGIAMRYVSNKFIPRSELAEDWSFSGYLSFAFGSGKLGAIVGAYAAMSTRLLGRARAANGDRRARHYARLAELARKVRLPEWKLRIVDAQRRMPASTNVGEVLSALMLDRLALTGGTLAALFATLALPVAWSHTGLLAIAFCAIAVGIDSRLASLRESVQPQERMKVVAGLIRRMVSAPIVVMGHAHDAVVERNADGCYVNTGSWVEGNKQHPDALRAFTHLVLRRTPKGPVGGLFRWVNGRSVKLEAVRARP